MHPPGTWILINICYIKYDYIYLYGGFLKWWYPTTMGFPTKKRSFWDVLGIPPFKKTPILKPFSNPIFRFRFSWRSNSRHLSQQASYKAFAQAGASTTYQEVIEIPVATVPETGRGWELPAQAQPFGSERCLGSLDINSSNWRIFEVGERGKTTEFLRKKHISRWEDDVRAKVGGKMDKMRSWLMMRWKSAKRVWRGSLDCMRIGVKLQERTDVNNMSACQRAHGCPTTVTSQHQLSSTDTFPPSYFTRKNLRFNHKNPYKNSTYLENLVYYFLRATGLACLYRVPSCWKWTFATWPLFFEVPQFFYGDFRSSHCSSSFPSSHLPINPIDPWKTNGTPWPRPFHCPAYLSCQPTRIDSMMDGSHREIGIDAPKNSGKKGSNQIGTQSLLSFWSGWMFFSVLWPWQ